MMNPLDLQQQASQQTLLITSIIQTEAKSETGPALDDRSSTVPLTNSQPSLIKQVLEPTKSVAAVHKDPSYYTSDLLPNHSLASWVHIQHSLFKTKSLCKNHIAKLNYVGFTWEIISRDPINKDDDWVK
jgi:hypothetical protein